MQYLSCSLQYLSCSLQNLREIIPCRAIVLPIACRPWENCRRFAGLCSHTGSSRILTMVLSGTSSRAVSLVVLGLLSNSANPFFMYSTSTVSSFSSLGAVFNLLVTCEFSHCSSLTMQLFVFQYLDQYVYSPLAL